MAVGDIRGLCPDRFHRVREVFADHFDQGLEIGARFALAIEVRWWWTSWADSPIGQAFGPMPRTP